MNSPTSVDQKKRLACDAAAGAVIANSEPNVSSEPPQNMMTGWNPRMLRNYLRPVSALVLLAFVVCHLVAHSLLLVSLDQAEAGLYVLMYPWRTAIGTVILASALLIHFLNALWSSSVS